MSNFTKSIFYSGLVMAAGLVAVFAIYGNMTGSNPAAIEPAAGEQTTTESIVEGAETMATEAGEAAADAYDATTEAVTEGAEDLSDNVESAVESAVESLEATTTPAATETTIEPSAGTTDEEAEALRKKMQEQHEQKVQEIE